MTSVLARGGPVPIRSSHATPTKVDAFVSRNQHINLSIVCQPRNTHAATLTRVDALVPRNTRVELSRVCQPRQLGGRLAMVPIVTAEICVKHICTANRTKVDEYVPLIRHVNLRTVRQLHQPESTDCISKSVVLNVFLPHTINTQSDHTSTSKVVA